MRPSCKRRDGYYVQLQLTGPAAHSYESDFSEETHLPFETSLIEITVIIMLGHGREQFSNSIHSAVYVNHLSGAGGHVEVGWN